MLEKDFEELQRKMRIVTNIWYQEIAGITQYLLDFLKYISSQKMSNFFIYGVDLIHPIENRTKSPKGKYENYLVPAHPWKVTLLAAFFMMLADVIIDPVANVERALMAPVSRSRRPSLTAI